MHSVAQAVATAVLLSGDLSARWGLWRSDAAGAAQCGSGEAALCLLPIPHSLSLFLIPNLLSRLTPPLVRPFLLLHSSVILHCCFSLCSPSFSSFCLCSSPALLLAFFVTSGGSTRLHGYLNCTEVSAAFGCSDLVSASIRGGCI